MKNLRRSVVALATVLACLVLMAAPAAATPHAVTITGGTLRMAKTTFQFNIPFAGTTGTGCGSILNFDSSATTGVDITTYVSISRIGSHVVVVSRVISTPGISLFNTGFSQVGLTVTIDFYTPTNTSPGSTSCQNTGSSTCKYLTTLTVAGTFSGWALFGTVTATAPAATLELLTPPYCLSLYGGGTATLLNGLGYVTS